jgi:hypothetical protein
VAAERADLQRAGALIRDAASTIFLFPAGVGDPYNIADRVTNQDQGLLAMNMAAVAIPSVSAVSSINSRSRNALGLIHDLSETDGPNRVDRSICHSDRITV